MRARFDVGLGPQCHPECTREGSRAADTPRLPEIPRGYARDDKWPPVPRRYRGPTYFTGSIRIVCVTGVTKSCAALLSDCCLRVVASTTLFSVSFSSGIVSQ